MPWFNSSAWKMLQKKTLDAWCFFYQSHRLCSKQTATGGLSTFSRGQIGTNCSPCLQARLALQCAQCKLSPFLCDHGDMGQNTRCSVAECREFNERRLIFTPVCVSVCAQAVRSLHSCQAQQVRRSRQTGMQQHLCLCEGFPLLWSNTQLDTNTTIRHWKLYEYSK